MPRRHVVFDDQFFESLSRRVSDERDGAGKPSRTDVLVYVIMPLMDLLADDYERNTLAVDHEDNLRVLVQTSPFVNWVQLWCYIDGDDVHVYDVDLHRVQPPRPRSHLDDPRPRVSVTDRAQLARAHRPSPRRSSMSSSSSSAA